MEEDQEDEKGFFSKKQQFKRFFNQTKSSSSDLLAEKIDGMLWIRGPRSRNANDSFPTIIEIDSENTDSEDSHSYYENSFTRHVEEIAEDDEEPVEEDAAPEEQTAGQSPLGQSSSNLSSPVTDMEKASPLSFLKSASNTIGRLHYKFTIAVEGLTKPKRALHCGLIAIGLLVWVGILVAQVVIIPGVTSVALDLTNLVKVPYFPYHNIEGDMVIAQGVLNKNSSVAHYKIIDMGHDMVHFSLLEPRDGRACLQTAIGKIPSNGCSVTDTEVSIEVCSSVLRDYVVSVQIKEPSFSEEGDEENVPYKLAMKRYIPEGNQFTCMKLTAAWVAFVLVLEVVYYSLICCGCCCVYFWCCSCCCSLLVRNTCLRKKEQQGWYELKSQF